MEPLEDLRIPRITELTQDCNIGLNDRKRRTSLATLADESCHYDAWLGHSLGSPKFNVLGVTFFQNQKYTYRYWSNRLDVIFFALSFMNLKIFLLISYLQFFLILDMHVSRLSPSPFVNSLSHFLSLLLSFIFFHSQFFVRLYCIQVYIYAFKLLFSCSSTCLQPSGCH